MKNKDTRYPARHPALVMAIFGSIMLPQVSAATDSAPDMTVTADASPEGNYSASETSVASKMPTARLDEVQSVSVVTQQQLEDFQASSLADAMRFVSGVSEANTLAGTEDGFVRRGFGSNADGSIYRDGIRSSQGLNFDALSMWSVKSRSITGTPASPDGMPVRVAVLARWMSPVRWATVLPSG